jgi:hypothetical protein
VGSEFPGKYVLVSVIVSDRSETRCIRVQRESAEWAPLKQKTACEFRSNMLCIGR